MMRPAARARLILSFVVAAATPAAAQDDPLLAALTRAVDALFEADSSDLPDIEPAGRAELAACMAVALATLPEDLKANFIGNPDPVDAMDVLEDTVKEHSDAMNDAVESCIAVALAPPTPAGNRQ